MLVVKDKTISVLWELKPFSWKFFENNLIVSTTNMADLSRGCEPRIRDLQRHLPVTQSLYGVFSAGYLIYLFIYLFIYTLFILPSLPAGSSQHENVYVPLS